MPIRIQYWINWEKRMGFTWKVTWNIFDSSRKRHVCWEWCFKKLNFRSGILRSRIRRWNPVLNVLALGGSMWYFTLRIHLGLHLGVHLGCSWGDNYGLYVYRWQCPTSIQSLFCLPWSYKYRSLCLRRRNHIYLKIFLLLDLQSIFTVIYVDTKRTIVIEFYYQLLIHSTELPLKLSIFKPLLGTIRNTHEKHTCSKASRMSQFGILPVRYQAL